MERRARLRAPKTARPDLGVLSAQATALLAVGAEHDRLRGERVAVEQLTARERRFERDRCREPRIARAFGAAFHRGKGLCFGKCFVCPPDDGHVHAVTGKAQCDGAANSATAAGHNRSAIAM